MAQNKILDQKWENCHITEIKKKAGGRYTPELNVDLPISEIFYGLGRTQEFYTDIRSHLGKFNKRFRYVSSKYDNKETQELYRQFQKSTAQLIKLLTRIKEFDNNVIPWKHINSQCQKTQDLLWKLLDRLREDKEKADKEQKSSDKKDGRSLSDRLSSDINDLYQAQREIRFFQDFSSSTKAKLSNKPFLLLSGLAGSGKTHLLCDVVENRFSNKTQLPAVLVFGEFFVGGKDPWEQISGQLNLNVSKSQLLKMLNSAGKTSNTRVLIIIDAINETRAPNYWKRNLKKVVDDVKKYPHLSLVVSVRSGFEKEVLTKQSEKLFILEEHRGFEFREWEAVSKFFKEFNLPLPEIPLLMPEFQNPLFLLLFCKAFQKRSFRNAKGKSKQIFRGHEGATYIFESFVDNISKKITKQFKITGPKSNVWDFVIEKIAAEMVDLNDDRITEETLTDIVKNCYPTLNHEAFIKELERNLLVVKVPRYTKDSDKYEGFDYRFPFQKFSDHLLGRYLFKKYEQEFGNGNKNTLTAKRFFSKRRKLGKYLSKSWNRGLIETLSIQCPEHLKGEEFVDVAPYLKGSLTAEGAFIDSLIWRKPDAFSPKIEGTRKYINDYVIQSENGHNDFLNALLTVAPIPNHPLNAEFLHKHLSRFSMQERDSWWSTFLHYQNGNKNSVDRLIEWGWSNQDKSHIGDESIRLCAIALCWFLATPNRFIRDRATKALVEILTNRAHVMLEILKLFYSVNDQYVLERVYAVAYGCTLRSSNGKKDLKNLAEWVYKTQFKKNKPTVHILTRDYARGIIEAALHQNIRLTDLDKKKIIPPFYSKWPKSIPSEKTLKKRYYPEEFFKDKSQDRGYLDIWSSVMYSSGSLADWGNYVLDSAVNHWSGRRLNAHEPNRKELLKKFKMRLNPKQRNLLEAATNRFYGVNMQNIFKQIKFVSYRKDSLDMEKIKKEEEEQGKRMTEIMAQFESILRKRRKKYFQKEIKPYLDDRGGVNDPLERFDTGLAQRWVFNRVVQLGWNSKLHGQFDGSVNYNRGDRSDHKPERIGKKYQWIAMHELLARIADNFEFKDETKWLDKTTTDYEGSWQIGVRDIDPSCVLKDGSNTKPDELPTFNNFLKSSEYNAWGKRNTDLSWLRKSTDLPDPKNAIHVIDDSGVSWLIAEGFVEWQKETPPEHEKYDLPTRTLWYMTKSYLVKNRNVRKLSVWADKQNFYGRWMPESHEFYDIYLAEYPWAPSFLHHYVPYYNHDEWTTNGRGTGDEKIPAKILVTNDEYLSSGSSKDCSTNEAIRVNLPAKWIFDRMGLVQKSSDSRFFDKHGDLIAFDPFIFDRSFPSCLLIRKDRFIDFLKKEKCSIMWTLLGEKGLIGGRDDERSGRLEINGVYFLNPSNSLVGKMKSKFVNFNKPVRARKKAKPST